MTLVKCFMTAVVLVGMAVSAIAETPARSGLYLGGGLGLQSTSVEGTQNGTVIGSEVNFGPLTTLKAGYYITPRVAVYGLSELAWWWDPDADSAAFVGLTGVGSTYYFRESLGPYVEVGVGLSYLRVIERDNNSNGGAYSFGVGAEVRPNLQFGLIYQINKTEETITTDSTTDSLKEAFSSNVLGLKVEYKY